MTAAIGSFVFAVITTVIALAALRLGVRIGREQEYYARTRPLLEELVWIESVTSITPAASADTINRKSKAALEKFGLKKHAPNAPV